MSEFSQHPDFKVSVNYVGEEQQPVVVIDNLVNDAEKLRELASHRMYSVRGRLYPGVRADAPPGYPQLVLDLLEKQLIDVFNLNCQSLKFTFCCYSLVTVPKEKLQIVQRMPHFDSSNMNELAMVHYLFPTNAYNGTSFYRHRESGYEYVDDTRSRKYIDLLNDQAKRYPAPPAEYINGDTELFVRIKSCEGVFNRALIYRRTSLHSPDLPKDFKPILNPKTGRLSINSFMEINS